MNDAGTPTSPYGATEIAPKPYSETPAPECRPDVNPRPEAWNPGVPNYPWWKLNFAAPPPPIGGRICEIYLLAWIKEITRMHADDWLKLNQEYEQKQLECARLQKAIAARDYEGSR